MIDDIIDGQVGRGDSELEQVSSGNYRHGEEL